MKKTIALVFSALLALCCTTAQPESGKNENTDPVITVQWRDTYNGHLLLCLADAYAEWENSGKLPTTIKWDGVSVFNIEYLRAGLTLAVRMLDDPSGWMNEDVDYPSATCSFTSDEPFLPREVPFSEFEQTLRDQYANMLENNAVALHMTIADHPSTLSSTGLAVMICRAFAHYSANEKFPDTIDTWESSYTRSTDNCDISAPEVKAARDAAWAAAGVTEASTDAEKAEAIFNYARDEWEWENYNNTKKGAALTITSKAGNCCDLSHAICAMCRLSGIPCRYFHAQCKYSSGVIGHVISQPFTDGEWHWADASNNGNSYGTVAFDGYSGLHYYENLPF